MVIEVSYFIHAHLRELLTNFSAIFSFTDTNGNIRDSGMLSLAVPPPPPGLGTILSLTGWNPGERVGVSLQSIVGVSGLTYTSTTRIFVAPVW